MGAGGSIPMTPGIGVVTMNGCQCQAMALVPRMAMFGGGGLHVNCLAGMNNGNIASAPAPSAMATAGSSGASQQS
eukprot:13988949-Ditylum_brightwellii.AAC.1